MVKELDSASYHSDNYEGSDWDSNRATWNDCNNSIVSQVEDVVILQETAEKTCSPSFGNISVTNGTDIHFGHKNFYQGPVTIKQFVYPNGESESEIPSGAIGKLGMNRVGGVDNTGWDKTAVIAPESVSNGVVPRELERVQRIWFWREWNWRKDCTMAAVILCIFFIILVILGLVLPKNTSKSDELWLTSARIDDEYGANTPIKGPIDTANKLKPIKLKLVSRLEWLAQPPIQPADPLVTPVPFVIISHTATENCSSQAQCIFQVRFIQTYHIESRGWWDIGYNFLVGGDGEAYVGRGWDKEGAHTYGVNKFSIGIAFIGTFIKDKPPEYQMAICKKLIQLGVQQGYIQANYTLLGARQLFTTQSPGDALYKEIQSWPRWSDNFTLPNDTIALPDVTAE